MILPFSTGLNPSTRRKSSLHRSPPLHSGEPPAASITQPPPLQPGDSHSINVGQADVPDSPGEHARSDGSQHVETAATLGTPVSKGAKNWAEGKLLRQAWRTGGAERPAWVEGWRWSCG